MKLIKFIGLLANILDKSKLSSNHFIRTISDLYPMLSNSSIKPPTFAILSSGRGSNARAILDQVRAGKLKSTPLAIIADKSDSKALELAEVFNIKKVILSESNAIERNSSLEASLQELNPDFITLAGYMKLIPLSLIKKY